MDLLVTPAPAHAEAGDGVWLPHAGDQIVGPPVLGPLLAVFVADLAADGGPELAVGGADGVIVTSLSAEGLESLPGPAGVRADGASDADERYGLEVTTHGARVWGPTPEAVHRGLTTLRQLVTTHREGVPAVRILDAPRFAWRGLSSDVVRTFHDVAAVKRVVDMCSLYKLNVLHLHLTDDQGWRFEVPDWPGLAEVGGAGALHERPGGHYTPADVAELVSYAAARFVTLVPEVDMPGHSQAAFRAYPELAPAPSAIAERAAAAGMPVGALDLDRGETRRFLADVLAAAAAQFPSAYLHIGGDEVFGADEAAQAAFIDEALATVAALGRKAVCWQEAARGGVTSDHVVQLWLDPVETQGWLDSGQMGASLPDDVAPVIEATFRESLRDLERALDKGARILVSISTRLYLDRPHGDEGADAEQEERRHRIGLPSYQPTPLRQMVEWDPLAVAPGLDSIDRVAGVEAAVWCETVTGRDDLDGLLLPRLAGVGERAWSAAATDWDSYVARLAAAQRTYDARGWAAFRPALDR